MDDGEVGPFESDDLASSHPGVRGEVQGRVEPLPTGGAEERAELSGGPRSCDTAGRWASTAARLTGDVAVDEPPGDGVIECGATSRTVLGASPFPSRPPLLARVS